MKNYDPKRQLAVFGGLQLQGFQKGTFIEVERNADTFTVEAGADGDPVRTRSHDKTATITVTLQGSSPSNDPLSLIMLADEQGTTVDAGVKPFMIKDLNGTTLLSAAECWIKKPPQFTAADEHTPRVWVFECGKLDVFIGGFLR